MPYLANKIKQNSQIGVIQLTLYLALYFTLAINLPLLNLLKQLYLTKEISLETFFTMPVALFAVFILFFLPLTIRYLEKPLFIVLLMVSSCVSYASFYYKTIFNPEMIDNILQTDFQESIPYINFNILLWVLVFGVLPSCLVYRVNVSHSSLWKEISYKLFTAFISIILLVVIGVFYYKDYASVIRNHTNLQKMIVPTELVSSLLTTIKEKCFTAKLVYKQIGLDAHIATKRNNRLVVLVIGETARSANYSLNGYTRNTNPFTQSLGVISYKHVYSCGTSTAISLPCMFSNLGQKKFQKDIAENQDNILDIIKRAGVNVYWLDNNTGCKGICKNVTKLPLLKNESYCNSSNCQDLALYYSFKNFIQKNKQQDSIVVLHLIGSHGPAYFERYPKELTAFKPDCRRSDIQNCTQSSLVNTYDNTIYYTDFVISKIINLLTEERLDASVIYISDHGESLGEKGIFLHGSPYFLAPIEQKHIPLITWFSDSLVSDMQLNTECLTLRANQKQFSHDNLFHSLLGIMDIETNAYRKKMDIFSPCRKKMV